MARSEVVEMLLGCSAAIRSALSTVEDWAAPGRRPHQYGLDLVADAAAVSFLDGEGVAVLSEETGPTGRTSDIVVVVDPVDGSGNAARGINWYAASLCALDHAGVLAAVVDHLVAPDCYTAERGAGAWRNGRRLQVGTCRRLEDAHVALCGLPAMAGPWRTMRAWGAAALELSAVAAGSFDAFVNVATDHHGPWDYLAACLVCTEAGAVVADAAGRSLLSVDWHTRRTPIAAATPELLEQVRAVR